MDAPDRALIFERRDERECVQLWRIDDDGKPGYELMINGVFIMASYNALSSKLLVRNALARYAGGDVRLLIGGLGLGYSVEEACLHSAVRRVTVVEINPLVIECNRTHLMELNGRWLSEPRVELVQGDFIDCVRQTSDVFDVICMDIDNGPMLIVNETNAAAYSGAFFADVRARLSERGVFVIWSCNPDDKLLSDMRRAFPDCFVEQVFEDHRGKPVPYYLYFGCNQYTPCTRRC